MRSHPSAMTSTLVVDGLLPWAYSCIPPDADPMPTKHRSHHKLEVYSCHGVDTLPLSDKVTADHFFPEWATSHIKKTSPTQILGSPVFEAHLELFKTIMTLFRSKVHNLEIPKSVDL